VKTRGRYAQSHNWYRMSKVWEMHGKRYEESVRVSADQKRGKTGDEMYGSTDELPVQWGLIFERRASGGDSVDAQMEMETRRNRVSCIWSSRKKRV